jgi:hypothetical protein
MSFSSGLLTAIAVLAAIAIRTTGASAQARPDFSGVWKPGESVSTPLPPPQPGGPPPPPRTVSMSITQSATDLRVDRRVEMDGRETVQTFAYKLDGAESVNQMGPLLFRTKAAWEGAALVLASVISIDDRKIGESRDVYRLENGELIVETTRQTPAGTFTARSVNRRN